MPNRLTRDELIIRGLSMAVVPNLEHHDLPHGVVEPDAFSLQWLQEILDFWYHMVPFSSSVTTVDLNAVANSDSITLPVDFILDVRNGYLVQTVIGDNTSFKRTTRVPLQKWVNRQLAYQSYNDVEFPYFYMIQGRTLRITPTPAISTVGKLWYYQLPDELESNEKPSFPNDYVITEYIRIRALEWVGRYEPGTAQKFCDSLVGKMKSAGLMNEPEDDEIPFDTITFRGKGNQVQSTYSWMGNR